MPQAVLAGFLVVHGLITTSIGFGVVTNPGAPSMALPAWLSWWPGPFGRSWLFDALGLGPVAAVLGGLLWLGAGLSLIAAALGWLGIPVLDGAWQALAAAGAGLGLVVLVLYFHPLYAAALAINLAILLLATGTVAAGTVAAAR